MPHKISPRTLTIYLTFPKLSNRYKVQAAKKASRITLCLFTALVITDGFGLVQLTRWAGPFADLLRLAALAGLTALFYWAATEKRVQFALSLFSALVISLLAAEWYLTNRLESIPDEKMGALFWSFIVAWFVAAGGLTTLFYRIVQ